MRPRCAHTLASFIIMVIINGVQKVLGRLEILDTTEACCGHGWSFGSHGSFFVISET